MHREISSLFVIGCNLLACCLYMYMRITFKIDPLLRTSSRNYIFAYLILNEIENIINNSMILLYHFQGPSDNDDAPPPAVNWSDSPEVTVTVRRASDDIFANMKNHMKKIFCPTRQSELKNSLLNSISNIFIMLDYYFWILRIHFPSI